MSNSEEGLTSRDWPWGVYSLLLMYWALNEQLCTQSHIHMNPMPRARNVWPDTRPSIPMTHPPPPPPSHTHWWPGDGQPIVSAIISYSHITYTGNTLQRIDFDDIHHWVHWERILLYGYCTHTPHMPQEDIVSSDMVMHLASEMT